MNKEQFLVELSIQLKKIPKKEREEILFDYAEYFEHALHRGRSEQDVIDSLGSPKKLAKELMADYHFEKAKTTHSYPSLFRAIYTSIGLGFFNLVFMLGPLIAIVAVIFAMYTVAGTFILTPFLVIINMIWDQSLSQAMFNMFTSFILVGLGILLLVGMNKFSKAFFGWFTRYLESNFKIIKGERKYE